MANSDISRYLEQPHKQYASVRLQQGRLLTDADHNEQGQLNEEQCRLVTLDLMGPRATPDEGFSLAIQANGTLTALNQTSSLTATNVTLGEETFPSYRLYLRPGNLYVAGKRCELPVAEPFLFQKHFLQMKRGDVPPTDYDEGESFAHLYVLQTWDQEVSAVEDPELLEPALGGLDTSTRLCRMRRVLSFAELPEGLSSLESAFSTFIRTKLAETDFRRSTGEQISRGRLQLTYVEHHDTLGRCDECNPKPAVRLLGAANATLRILLTAADRYVWALDNGAPLYRILLHGMSTLSNEVVAKRTLRVEMLTPPIDETAWPLPGRVVEVLPLGAMLDGSIPSGVDSPHYKLLAERIGAFLRAKTGYDPQSRSFELELTDGVETLQSFVTKFSSEHPDRARLTYTEGDACVFYCRFWHDASYSSTVDIPVIAGAHGAPIGDTGIVPVFHQLGRRGDYWIAALRPDHPRSVVPFDLAAHADGVPPHGPKDHFVPLALVTGRDGTVEYCTDARQGIGRAVDTGCVTYTVGDGVHSQGDFHKIQDAIDALPSFGGHILVRRGTYRERLELSARENVTIEACGENVVLETPPPASPPVPPEKLADGTLVPLVNIDNCVGVRLSGMRLHAIEERAVLVWGASSDVALASLTCRAGTRHGWAFVPGTEQPAGLPLISLQGLQSGTLSGIVLEPSSRQGLHANAQRLTVSGLTVISEPNASPVPTDALVTFENCFELLFEDSAVTAHGRVGISVENSQEVTLRQLSLIASRHRDRQGKTTQSREGVVLLDSTSTRLLSSWVTMDESPSDHAAVFVQGEAITLAQNHFEVLARCFESPSPSPPSPNHCQDLRVQAWGGIQLAGRCRNVEVRENQILGGIGHGITLGSYHFDDSSNSTKVRYGAGYGQISTRSDGQLGATGKPRLKVTGRYSSLMTIGDDGPLVDIRLLENRIEQMNGNGISVITVLGFPDDAASLIEVIGLRIAGNTIVDNLKAPAENIALAESFGLTSDSLMGEGSSSNVVASTLTRQANSLSVLPLGGIVLGAVTALDITGNVIVGNGHSQTAPTNGIFVLLGEQIHIAQNRIAGNGGRARIDSPSYSPPAGPAPGIRAGIAVLLAGTSGTKSPFADVTDNDDSDNQTDRAENESLASLAKTFDDSGASLDNGGSSLRILGNTVRHPEGRALHVVATGPVSVVGNFLSSEGNHGADNVSDAYMVGDVVYLQNLGAPWEGNLEASSSYTLDSRETAVNAPNYLTLRSTYETRAVYGEGGAIQFKDNQVTFDWEVLRVPHVKRRRPPLCLFPVALVSLDHLSIDGNQFAFRLRGRKVRTAPPAASPALIGYVEPVFGHVLGVGGTVQISNNRIAESVGSTLLSLVAIGELAAMATYNQSTHEMLVVSEAYDSAQQLAALTAPVQGAGTGERYFSVGGSPTRSLRLLNPHLFQDAKSITVTVATSSGTTGPVSMTLIVTGGARATVAAGISFTTLGGILTVPGTELSLFVARESLVAATYSLAPTTSDVQMIAEGTTPPTLTVTNPSASAPLNTEFELQITTFGALGVAGYSAPTYRYRYHGGEPWLNGGALTSTLTFNYPIGTSSALFTLGCANGVYNSDCVYRLTTYQPLSPVLPEWLDTDKTPIATVAVNTSDGFPTGAYRVLINILADGSLNSATTNAPPYRYSLDGGRSWSRVALLAPSNPIGSTGITLNIGPPMQAFKASNYFEFESYLPPLSRDLSWSFLTRLGNQVLFRPQGTALNQTALSRLVQFSKRFVVMLSRASS